MILTIIILTILVIALTYLVYAQNKKYNTILKYTETYVQFIGAIAIRTNATYDRMQEIDRLGAFQADDEVGMIFNELNENVTDLNQFITRYVNAGTEETNEKK
jgi:hypothetical protein